jgi:putative membrane protein (TIGR04086 family)
LVIYLIGLGIDPGIETQGLLASSVGIVISLLLVLSTIIGGWLAGRLAKEERFLHGFMVGGIGIVMLLIESFSGEAMPLDTILLQFVATGLAGLAGYVSRWTPARQREK